MKVRLLATDTEHESFILAVGSVDLPDVDSLEMVTLEPLSDARQWYLYDSIRYLCNMEAKKDKVAPLPTVPKPRTVPKAPSAFSKEKVPTARKVTVRLFFSENNTEH